MLPEQFQDRMKELLGEEYAFFLKSYENKQYKALRLNPLKTDRAQFLVGDCAPLRPVPWEENGFYYDEGLKPGRHSYHEAGVYYIQEPSAMAPAGYLEARPGERVLDLCAAPGGKSTQLAGAMRGEGLLICNEIHPARAKILSENIERFGVRGALVTNETPQALAGVFSDYFHKILVDAPCSGEGMFRKNEEAFSEWSIENIRLCADRQDEILDCAAQMLRPGGRLVYSTCTFAPEENEGSIGRFLRRHPEYRVLPVKKTGGMSDGMPVWAFREEEIIASLKNTIRLWPHHLEGEGHFIAVLEKAGSVPEDFRGYSRYGFEKGIMEQEMQDYLLFQKQYLNKRMDGTFYKFGDQLYLAPEGLPSLHKLKVLRPGLHLGTLLKNRFEPSHALALSLKPTEAVYTTALSSKDPDVYRYLSGQTLSREGEKGWYLVTVDGYSLGWGKLTGGILKNHYPKGLRKNLEAPLGSG
ncbi:MAG: RsmF rRNA methyltransferase first C-terminal domain-containing protein [Lachnospiraceae bacterium]